MGTRFHPMGNLLPATEAPMKLALPLNGGVKLPATLATVAWAKPAAHDYSRPTSSTSYWSVLPAKGWL